MTSSSIRRTRETEKGQARTGTYFRWRFSPRNIDYIWSEMYIDAMVARIKTGQTLYVQHDVNFNATPVLSHRVTVQDHATDCREPSRRD